MHDILFVRRFQSIGNLLRNTQSFVQRNPAFFDTLGQSQNLDVLHHKIIGADVVQGADMAWQS
jgi:hypothetical protein